jgi:hypothetical protein
LDKKKTNPEGTGSSYRSNHLKYQVIRRLREKETAAPHTPGGHPFGSPSCRERVLTVKRQNTKKGEGVQLFIAAYFQVSVNAELLLFPPFELW